MKYPFVFILIFLALIGCTKPNPNPESLDPIYQDLQKELAATTAEIEKEKKNLDEFQKELAKVQPQTGQIKYAQKRVDETIKKIDKLKQMQTYLQIKSETRKSDDKINYLRAYNENKPWPNPDEHRLYATQKRLEKAPRNWDTKQRLLDSQIGLKTPGESGKASGQGH